MLYTYQSFTTTDGVEHHYTEDSRCFTSKWTLLGAPDGTWTLIRIHLSHTSGRTRRFLQDVGPTWAQASVVRWSRLAARCAAETLEATPEPRQSWWTEEA